MIPTQSQFQENCSLTSCGPVAELKGQLTEREIGLPDFAWPPFLPASGEVLEIGTFKGRSTDRAGDGVPTWPKGTDHGRLIR